MAKAKPGVSTQNQSTDKGKKGKTIANFPKLPKGSKKETKITR